MTRLFAMLDASNPPALVELKATADGRLLVSSTGGGSGGSGSDRELVVSTYRCKTAFTGASVGDTITSTQIIDVTGSSPVTVSTIWRNQTTASDLSIVPAAANLELVGSNALTSAQLAAAGLALDATLKDGSQKTQVTSLPALSAGTNAIGSVQVSNFPTTQQVSISETNWSTTYAYNASGQITSETRAAGGVTQSRNYGYDAAGNLTSIGAWA